MPGFHALVVSPRRPETIPGSQVRSRAPWAGNDDARGIQQGAGEGRADEVRSEGRRHSVLALVHRQDGSTSGCGLRVQDDRGGPDDAASAPEGGSTLSTDG